MPTSRRPCRDAARRLWLGMLVLYVVWGSTYLGIADRGRDDPAVPDGGDPVRPRRARAADLVGRSRAGGSFAMPSRREWRDSAIVGALLLGGGMGMVAFGEQTIPSGIAALLIAMMPVWVAIFGRLFLGERLPRLAVVGIVVGFVGVAILVGPTIVGETGALDPLGLAALLISPISWALGSLYRQSHRATLPDQPLVATGLQMLCRRRASCPSMALLSGELGALRSRRRLEASRSLALAVPDRSSAACSRSPSTAGCCGSRRCRSVATYAYVNPVVAVILGAIVLGEPLDARTVVAGAVIVVAVALIVTARGRMQAPRGATAAEPVAASVAAEVTAPSTADAAEPAQDSGARSPGPATARSGAAGPRGSRARSRPG